MSSDEEGGKPKINVTWVKKEEEEKKPLLENGEEKKGEKYREQGMRFLYMFLQCCLPKFFKKKEEAAADAPAADAPAPKDKPVTQSPKKLSDIKEADEEVQEVVAEAAEGITDKLIEVKGGKPDDFEIRVVSYRTQVTIGCTYFVKINLNDGSEHFHVRIFKPVTGPAQIMDNLQFDKTEKDDIEYF